MYLFITQIIINILDHIVINAKRSVLIVLLSFLRAKAECFTRLCHRLGVRPSVCPSVTLVISIKTVQARIMKSSV